MVVGLICFFGVDFAFAGGAFGAGVASSVVVVLGAGSALGARFSFGASFVFGAAFTFWVGAVVRPRMSGSSLFVVGGSGVR